MQIIQFIQVTSHRSGQCGQMTAIHSWQLPFKMRRSRQNEQVVWQSNHFVSWWWASELAAAARRAKKTPATARVTMVMTTSATFDYVCSSEGRQSGRGSFVLMRWRRFRRIVDPRLIFMTYDQGDLCWAVTAPLTSWPCCCTRTSGYNGGRSRAWRSWTVILVVGQRAAGELLWWTSAVTGSLVCRWRLNSHSARLLSESVSGVSLIEHHTHTHTLF